MNALTHPVSHNPALARVAGDLHNARQSLERTLDVVRGHAQLAADHQVVGKFGDLQIRIDVAAALLERAERIVAGTQDEAEKTIAVAEASIAIAEALAQVGQVELELTGQRTEWPPSHDPLQDPLHLKYRLIGDFRLNGVVPPSARSAVDVP
ncbi:hypothetical protein HX866_07990 [Pseudomonas gingeri]|uniref:hypothetical protein n=1 Tax=Pseudomonas gingeri TaxID=117681 RepID=UPI00159F7EF1|nr:hypothetical protein [Pseudomonas gingeri]NWA24829.1 hypothetical protein [Pseudomonas gingeri]